MEASREPRVSIRCPLEFTHEDGITGSGTLCNLSLNGCAVQSDTPVSDNMLVTLRLTPSESEAPIVIEMGRVRWATMQEFGVEFLIVRRKERGKLAQFLRTAAPKSASADTTPSQAT